MRLKKTMKKLAEWTLILTVSVLVAFLFQLLTSPLFWTHI